MPTGPFVLRRLEEQFKPEKKEKFMLAYHWLDWLKESKGIHIQHKLNSGKEKKIEPWTATMKTLTPYINFTDVIGTGIAVGLRNHNKGQKSGRARLQREQKRQRMPPDF